MSIEGSEMHADIVVVGGGGCGLMVVVSSALTAPELRVVLLERDANRPCNSVIAGGFIPAAGTRFQRGAGVDDSPELMAEDILRKNGYRGDPQMTLRICEKATDTVHWFVDTLGVPLEFVSESTWPGHSRPRMHAHSSRLGIALVQELRDKISTLPNVIYHDRVSGRGLIMDGRGAVVGVLAGSDNETHRIIGRCVVLATGGFGANREMLGQYIPEIKDAPYVGSRTNTGDGIQWGLAVGATVSNMSGRQDFGYTIPGRSTRLSPGVIWSGGIVVNRAGLRVEREDQGPSEWAAVMLRQSEGFGVAIWDERIQRLHARQQTMVSAMGEGDVVQCQTVGELAERFALDGTNLTRTLVAYNQGIVDGRDPLGRRGTNKPLVPPYYAARITGSLAHTQGGLKIDLDGRAIRPDGNPVPNLYAGGGVAVGLSGDRPEGYLPGNGLLMAYTLGLIIGENVVASLRGMRG